MKWLGTDAVILMVYGFVANSTRTSVSVNNARDITLSDSALQQADETRLLASMICSYTSSLHHYTSPLIVSEVS